MQAFVAIIQWYSAVIRRPVITFLCAQQVFHQLEQLSSVQQKMPKLKKKLSK